MKQVILLKKKKIFNKERIISIVISLAMLMPFGESIFVFSAEKSAVATSDAGEVSLESYFLKPLSSPLPKVTDGFMKETEKELPKADGGFIEPVDKAYGGEEYKFIEEPDYEIPKVKDSGFIKNVKNLKSKPSKGEFTDEITEPDEDAIVIETPQDLANIKGGSYVLGCDIYLDEYNGGVWTPIEIRQDLTIDGQGHIIYNVNTDEYNSPGGLFSDFHGENLTVKNLGLSYTKECYVKSGALFSGYVGGKVEVENCFNEMNVTGDSWYCGGLFSQISSHEDVNISSSYNRGSVTGTGYMGGLVGVISSNASVNIYDCFNMGGIKGKTAGGIVGYIDWMTSGADLNVDIRRCENSAKITVENTNTDGSGGGILGSIGERFVSVLKPGIHYQFRHCKNTATVSVKANDVISAGGIIGSSYIKGIEFYNCTNQGGISTSKTTGASSGSLEYAGGIIGNSTEYAYFDSCFNKGRIVADNFSGGLCAEVRGGDFKSSVNSGVILSKSGNAGGLASCISYFIDSVIACYNTGNVTGKIWAGGLIGQSCSDVPIGYLYNPSLVMDSFNTGKISGQDAQGSSDGLQYLTSGIINSPKVIVSNCYNTGAITNGCGIASRAVDVKGCANYGDITTGAGIVFTCSANGDETYDGRIIDCFNIGNITSGFGICESAGDITNCYNKGNIIYDDAVAYTIRPGAFGIAFQAGNVKSCYNEGQMTGSLYAGGICHTARGNMTDCYNTGLISADYHACGLAVRVQKNVTYCYNTQKIEVTGFSFSLDGSYSTPMGALVGECEGKVKDSYNSGDFLFAGKSTYFGGLAGCSGGIENCYNKGNVQSVGKTTSVAIYVGGLSGGILPQSENPGIWDSYNTGDVFSGERYSFASGISAEGTGYIENCSNTGNIKGGYVSGISVTSPSDSEKYIERCSNTGILTTIDVVESGMHGNVYFCGASVGIGCADTISDSVNTSDVTEAGIGNATKSITNCVNLGKVTKIEKENDASNEIFTNGYGIGGAKKISYCINKGAVYGSAGIGGGNEIGNCINEGAVTSPGDGAGVALRAGLVYDCINKASVSGKRVGGIVFSAENIERCENHAVITASAQGGGISVDAESISDCKNHANVSGIQAGGISVCAKYSVTNCTNYGKITASANGGGGIVSGCEMDSDEVDKTISGENIDYGVLWRPEVNSLRFALCKNYGDVSAWVAFGIGDGVSHSACENYGNIISKSEGAGIGRGTMYGCKNTGNVTVYSAYDAAASGLCVTSDWRTSVMISNCINSGSISANGSDDVFVGGLFDTSKDNAYVTNSQNTGAVSAHSRHEYEDRSIGIYAGGVGAVVEEEFLLFIDDASGSETSPSATVDTKFTGDEEHDRDIGEENKYSSKILAYGAIYEEAKEILPESVSISGPELMEKDDEAMFSSVVLPEDADSKSLVWSSDNPTVASVSWDGTVKGISKGKATITAKTYNGKSASKTVEVLENAIHVTVMGLKKDKPGEFFPLSGASVRAGGTSKTTDENGKTWFDRADLPDSALAPIHIDAGSEYISKDDNINLILNTLGTNSFTYYLLERDDSIYIKSASVTVDGDVKNMITNPGMVHIPLMKNEEINKTAYYVNVEVDWGKYEDNPEDRRVWIEGAESKNTYSIYEKGDWISFATFFDAEESLKLVATTKNKDGETVRAELVLPLDVKLLDVKLDIASTDNLPVDNIYFLDKLGFKLGIGDIGRFADEISVENGILKVKFTLNHSKNESKAKFGILSGEVGPKVDITGTVKIPLLLQQETKWSGMIGIKARGKGGKMGFDSYNETEERTVKIFGHEHNFFIGNVPCYIDVEFGAGIEAALGIAGRYEKPFFEGQIGGYADASIGGGVGGSMTDNFKLKFGPEGSLEVDLPVVLTWDDQAEEKVSFEPQLKGTIDAVFELEFFDIIDIAPEVELGKFTWNRHDGGKWEHFLDRFDQKMKLQGVDENFDLKNATLTPKGRDYLKCGGGFEEGGFSLMSSGGDRRIYSNILSSSDASTAITDGTKRIIYTTDNPERDSHNVMSLVYTDCIDGVWTEPKEVDSDGTVDSNVSADGKFIVWENINSKLKSGVTLGELLGKTDIKAGVFDGEKYVLSDITKDDAYDFGAKVKASGDKALMAYITNSQCDVMAQDGRTDICYSIYDNGWSEVSRIENVGSVVNLNLIYDGEDAKIIYKKDNVLYVYDIMKKTSETLFENAGRYAVSKESGKILTADFDSDEILHIRYDGKEEFSLETEYNKKENPVIVSDGNIARIFWTENDGIYYTSNASGVWSEKLCLKGGISGAFGISGIAQEGQFPSVTYYFKEDSLTHLSHIESPCEEVLMSANPVVEDDGKILLDVYNNTERTLDNVMLKVQTGKDVPAQDSESVSLSPGEVKTLTISLSPETLYECEKIDVWAECGIYMSKRHSVLFDEKDISVQSAFFTVDEAGDEFLTIRIKNEGNTKVDTTDVSVFENSEDGTPIYSFKVATLLSGEYSEIRIPHQQSKDSIYYVRVNTDGDIDESNNFDIIAYERVELQSEDGEKEFVFDSQTNEVKIKVLKDGFSSDEGTVVAALYEKGGKLLEVRKDTFKKEDEYVEKTFTFEKAKKDCYIKIMYLSDTESMKPLRKPMKKGI